MDFLGENRVPEHSLSPIQKLSADHASEEVTSSLGQLVHLSAGRSWSGPKSSVRHFSAVSADWPLGHCMPYLNHEKLVRLLTVGWGATCNYKQLLRKKAFKLCSRLEADNKVDHEELEEARRKRDDIDRACSLANLKLYKLRVLCTTYEDAQGETKG